LSLTNLSHRPVYQKIPTGNPLEIRNLVFFSTNTVEGIAKGMVPNM